MPKPNYTITQTRHFILISRTNDWDFSSEVNYLSELAEALEKYKRRPFSIFADLRGWHIPDDIRYGAARTNVSLDRRSQKGECWLLDTPNQADHLLRHFVGTRFTLEHVLNEEDAINWAGRMADEAETIRFKEWLASQSV